MHYQAASSVNQEKDNSDSATIEQISDDRWISLYKRLQTLATHWVYNAHVNSWYGQENDVAWDIVLVAIERTFEYSLNAKNNGLAIISLERLSVTIARNYYRDLLRKERRLVHFDQVNSSTGYPVSLSNVIDPSEIAFDVVYTDLIYTQIANAVVTFPEGTRTALLIDLASRMHFDADEYTPLQRAFTLVGIRLQDYQNLFPKDPIAKSRYASLLTVAYKRLANLFALRTRADQAEYDFTKRTGATSNSETRPEPVKEKSMENKPDEHFTSVIDHIHPQQEVVAYVEKLQEPYRSVTRLHYVEGYSYLDIAKQLQLKTGTVKSLCSRGKNKLDKLIAQENTENSSPEDKQITMRSEISACIGKLEEPYRTAVYLKKVEQRSYPDIAAQLNLKIGTVKSHVSRGMRMLSEQIAS